MEKLTREELEKLKHKSVACVHWVDRRDAVDTALTLYTENSELSKELGQAKAELLLMKDKVEAKLKEWKGYLKAGYEDADTTSVIRDLADITKGVGK